MAMQIQRGLVKYKDRSDIVCTYGITDAGLQYYFLEDGKLANGNIVVTSTLLEAVDPLAQASHVGVIDGNGNIVIPCEYKSIKSIANDVLLVERAQPVSESVLESIRLREDPLAATKLVTTPASIKDKLNNLMGETGRFVFNDQFSEATIFDIFGNNLVSNEYFSFIGINDEKVFLNKNIVESEVVEYPLYPINEEVINNKPSNDLDVNEASASVGSIDQAITEQQDVYNEEVAPQEEVYSEEAVEPVNNGVYSEEMNVPNDEVDAETTYEEEAITPSNDNESFELPDVDVNAAMPMGSVEATPEEAIANDTVEPSVSEEDSELDKLVKKIDDKIAAIEADENIPEEAKEINIPIEDNDQSEEKIEYNTEVEPVKEEVGEETEKAVEEVEEVKEEIEEETPVEEPVKSEVQDNDVYSEDDYYVESNNNYSNDVYDYDYDEDISYNSVMNSYDYDTITSSLPPKNLFDDVTTTISNLVELNRNLQAMVDEYEIKLNKCNTSRKKLIELSKTQAREISSLNARVARLEADKQVLESKLASLTPSSNGELVRVMADAHNIIGKTQTRMRRKNSL